jgi:hypothetical protein
MASIHDDHHPFYLFLAFQFLLQNGMPVTAAALQKECEKLLLAKSSGASSNGGNKTARGRQQQRQESERCLADRLLDGKRAAQQQNVHIIKSNK